MASTARPTKLPMRDSPRIRRLHSDLKSLQQLATDSSIFDFTPYGTPPDFYVLRFSGPGCHKPDPSGNVIVHKQHEVHIRLGANYPRTMPDLAWKTPIFHPNISTTGVVCLGGYGTHWAPSLALDELCSMLWDMLRLANYDETSPYNREAAAWAKHQSEYVFPLDPRPLRDRLVPGTFGHVKELCVPRSAPLVPIVETVEAEVVEPLVATVVEEIVFIE